MLPVLVQSDDLHGNVAGLRVLFQLIEYRPPQHIWQEYVERHGSRMELTRERERVGAAHRDDHLESLIVGKVDEDAGVMRVVLDNQEYRVLGLQIIAIVRYDFHRLHGPFRRPGGRKPGGRVVQRRVGASVDAVIANGWPGVSERQVERKRAANVGRAAQLDFTAEQAGELSANG